ncbi:MAG: hypothetical protein SFZ02_16565 [bacterium]|nr:hypothetical protein [bacterium]
MLKRILILFFILLSVIFVTPVEQVQGQSCSNGNGAPTTLILVNNGSEAISYYWLGFNCQEIPYGSILPGQLETLDTYDGHEWIARTASGDEVGRGVASSETVVTVSIGSMNFNMPESPLDFVYRPDEDWEWAVIDGHDGCEIRPTTPADGLDPFYQKVCFYEGVPIASSNAVPDEALYEAWNIMANMLQGQSLVVEKLLEINMMMGIVAEDEGITVLPQYAFLRNDPNMDWDVRARGLGGNVFTPLGSGAEENLLCYDTDPYLGESIFLHEFAHTMKDGGIALIDPTFNIALNMAYQQAIDTGLWANTYALETIEEYWAEGVQGYFNTNLEAIPTNGIHNDINTREELMAYDPTLFAMIDIVFAGFEWIPTCPE